MHRSVRRLIFENGRIFDGIGFGTAAQSVAEVTLHTSMAGYQEVLSDPSGCGQLLCMTYPLIGSCGLADEDYESVKPSASGLIVREYNDHPSNFRCARTLSDFMAEHGIPGIAGVDTRAITRMLRAQGPMRAMLTHGDMSAQEGVARIAQTPAPHDQVRRVSTRRPWHARTPSFRYTVAVLDLGVRRSIVRRLNEMGCNVTVLPYSATADQVLALRPDGLLLSNGPGDPADVPEAAALVRALQGRLPLLGVDLGHLVVAAANGAGVYRMRQGHHGGNHPVRRLADGRIDTHAQNHSFAVDADTASGTGLSLTHQNVLDGTVEGLESDALSVLSVQFQPDDATLGRFAAMMEAARGGKEPAHA